MATLGSKPFYPSPSNFGLEGITIRQHVATEMMKGLIAANYGGTPDKELLALRATELADTLLRVLES